MNYLDKISDKRQKTVDTQLESDKLQVFTDLSDGIKEVFSTLEKTGAKKLDKQVVDAINKLESIVESIASIKVTSDSDIKDALISLASAMQSIKVQPVVNVPAPQVTVNEKEVDFKPIIDALGNQKYVAPTGDPLSEYKAQDINNDDPHRQYVGFVNPKGNWYIIENDETNNSLRYVFGTKNYLKAMQKPAKLNYRLYSDAIKA